MQFFIRTIMNSLSMKTFAEIALLQQDRASQHKMVDKYIALRWQASLRHFVANLAKL